MGFTSNHFLASPIILNSSAINKMSSTSVVSLMIFAFLALFAIVSAQNYGVRDPFAYQNSVGYGYRQFPYVDPYNDAALNGGTPSSWYDQILIHAVPRG